MTALRAGLCILIAFSVLAFGTVQVWSESILEAGAGLLFFYWALVIFRNADAKIEWNSLNVPLLGLIGIGLLQLLFHGTGYPFLTRVELLKLAAYFIVFFLSAQAFRTRADLTMLAWCVILFCFVVSVLTIIQHFTAGQTIYWVEPVNGSEPYGPYVNRNHFAGFVELTLPMGLALMAFRGVRRDVMPLMTLFTIVPLSALVLSGSRGGLIGFAFEICILGWMMRKHGALRSSKVAAIGAVVIAAVFFVSWVGASRAIQRLSALKSPEVSVGRRVSMARSAVHIFLDHPLKGCGLGTMVAVFPRYETDYDGRIVEHVHNDYLEGLAESGLLGALCGAAFLWLLFRQARKNLAGEQGRFSLGLHVGALMAVGGLLVHSVVDFNLQLPANALLFLLQVYLVTTPALPSDGVRPGTRRRVQEHGEMAEQTSAA
ncbi:MAG TPA: O-antigen ligase family protein [Candidatus Acidoferrales bacterium]|jgi:O-antigen ligase|nr:O-antigen ligase family protein [Candidatus Acidoferrales bacterium]